jgi:osmotically inducible lipoprotein OsmB
MESHARTLLRDKRYTRMTVSRYPPLMELANMRKILVLLTIVALTACGSRPSTRAVTGGLMGAGGGAVVGGATGLGAGTGALIGGAGGAGVGAVTAPRH